MIDWLATWGVLKVGAFFFKPILEDLATDFARDTAKDYVKGCFGSVFSPFRKDRLQRVLGKALLELLQLFQDELLDEGLNKRDLKEMASDVKKFIRSTGVQEAIRQAFTESGTPIDPALLALSWKRISGCPLPTGFSWQRIASRFSRSVHSLREEDIELYRILQGQAVIETASGSQQLAGVVPEFNLELYCDALLERYANLHLETLDTTGAYYSNVKLWSVFIPQAIRECQAYSPQILEMPKENFRRLLDKEEEKEDEKESESTDDLMREHHRVYLDQAPRPVIEILEDDRAYRIVILGDPGSGKSSLLQYLALRWARRETSQRYELQLPLLIELREYDRWECPSGRSFVRYLHEASTWHRLNQFDLVKKLHRRGAIALLLDGLDEIFDPVRREQVINDVHRFSNEYPNARIILTSRSFGYKKQRLTDIGFRHFILQELDDHKIADFIDLWHDVTITNEDDREVKRTRLKLALSDSFAIRELAGNPLLLTMMAILNRNQELPRERAHLYEQSTRILLHEWDTERALSSHPQLRGIIGYKEKVEILRDVADFMQFASKGLSGNIIDGEDLEQLLHQYLKEKLNFQQPHGPSRDIVNQLRERNFILCFLGSNSYAFVHRTFLEYFCASAIVQKFQHLQLVSFEQLLEEIFGNHWQDESWHEVLCLIAGLIHERFVEQIVEFLLRQIDDEGECNQIFLAARCFLESRHPVLIGSSRNKLYAELDDLVRWMSGGEPRSNDYKESKARIQARAVRFLAKPQLNDFAHTWLIDMAIKSNSGAVRQAAVQEFAKGWKDDTSTLLWLKDQAVNSNDWVVRLTAVQELVRGWKGDPDTLRLLKDRVKNDGSKDVCGFAVQEIARGWKEVPATLQWLKKLLIKKNISTVRHVVVKELARGWRDDPEVLKLLKDIATTDESREVSDRACKELKRGWKDDPEVLELVEWLTRKD